MRFQRLSACWEWPRERRWIERRASTAEREVEGDGTKDGHEDEWERLERRRKV
jgi:hypothetical protein